MALPLFPLTPMPAGLNRTVNWGESTTTYDSGEFQGSTAFVRPLLTWTIPVSLMTEIKQSSLWAFQKTTKGMIGPFLLKDPYEFRINSMLGAGSGFVVVSGTAASTLYFRDTNSYMVRPDTTTIGSMFSILSGYVTLGVEYSVEQDTGIVTIYTKASTDIWSVRSLEYFRKAHFTKQYGEGAILWNLFSTTLTVAELP